MLKNHSGITLVSLVITIIVLLILATVAITLAVNAEGIFPRAQYATDQWNAKVQEEGEALQNSVDYLESHVTNEMLSH